MLLQEVGKACWKTGRKYTALRVKMAIFNRISVFHKIFHSHRQRPSLLTIRDIAK